MAATRSELIEALADRIGTAPLTQSEIEACLALAAVAAHGTGDRTSAPLACFLAGMAASQPEHRAATLDELRGYTAELTPPPKSP